MSPYRVVPLHEADAATVDATVALLNRQWPRSDGARRAALEKSCADLPIHLVLVDQAGAAVGHCAVEPAADDGGGDVGVVVSSLVVTPDRRGAGLGRLLMDAAEDHARACGRTRAHLSTKDKEAFYRHLGYGDGAPVTTLGRNAGKLSSAQLGGLQSLFGGRAPADPSDRDAAGLVWLRKDLRPAAE